ncbi:MAG: leucine-rich repeat domain-containing protein [Pirellulaceae bacterium]
MSRRRWLCVVVGGVIVVLCVCVAWWMLAGPRAIADPYERAEETRLTQFALLCYVDSHGHYPRPTCRDPWGRPLSSWRLKLRGWIEQVSQLPEERTDLPWHAPENLRWLLDSFSQTYVFGSQRRAAPGKIRPNLVAVVGPDTAFGDGTSTPSHVPGDTIVLVETAGLDIYWTQPGDLDVRDVPPSLVDGIDGLGVHVAFADGEVWYLEREVPLAVLKRFFTVEGAATRDREAELSPYCKNRVAYRDPYTGGTALCPRLPDLRTSPWAPRGSLSPPVLGQGLLVLDAVSPQPGSLFMQQFSPEQQEVDAAIDELESLGAEGIFSGYDMKSHYSMLKLEENWRGAPQQLKLLNKFPGLKEIHVRGPWMDDEALEIVASVAGLQLLFIENTRITPAGFDTLQGADQLIGLSLSHIDVTSTVLSVISRLQLRCLEMRLGHDLPAEAPNAFAQLSSLVSLTLSGEAVGQSAALAVGGLHELCHLDLRGTSVRDADLEHWQRLPYLTHIDLSGTRVTGPGLSHILPASHLKVLVLDSLKLEEESWSTIAQFQNLEALSLNHTTITDAGLGALVKLRNLRTISLEGTHTSDAGLQLLLSLPHILTARDAQGDIVVIAEDWLLKHPGRDLQRLAKSEGKRLYQWLSNRREEIVDAIPQSQYQEW